MAIPDFVPGPDGYDVLPVGRHVCTITEMVAACVTGRADEEDRLELLADWNDFRTMQVRAGLSPLVYWINGGFVTMKTGTSDIDFLTIFDGSVAPPDLAAAAPWIEPGRTMAGPTGTRSWAYAERWTHTRSSRWVTHIPLMPNMQPVVATGTAGSANWRRPAPCTSRVPGGDAMSSRQFRQTLARIDAALSEPTGDDWASVVNQSSLETLRGEVTDALLSGQRRLLVRLTRVQCSGMLRQSIWH